MVSQEQVLNRILDTKDFSIITLNNLTEDFFFNYKNEFNYIKNHYETYRCVPDKVTFKSVFNDFTFIDVKEPENYLLEQLYNDYNRSYLATRFNKIKEHLENNDTNAAMDYFLHSVDNLRQGSALTCTDLISDRSRLDNYLERCNNPSKYYISTGFPELDNIIGGIDTKNEDMVIAARTGIGKTQTMIKMAVSAALQGLAVGIYEGEMTTDKIGYRVDTMLGNIQNSSLNHGDPFIKNQYTNYINSLPLRNLGPIKVITPNDIAGKPTVSALRAFIEKEHLDILFVDQYSLLEDTSYAKTSFERVGNIAKEIKKLQVEKQIPIIAVSQMNRTKNEDGSKDTTQIGLSDMIPQYATVLIMLDKKDDRLEMSVVKARDGGDGKKLTYLVNWNIGSFEFIPEEVAEAEAKEMEDRYSEQA